MTKIVRDTGFVPEDWALGFTGELDQAKGANMPGLDLEPLVDLSGLADHLDQIACIRIPFTSFADGRGFTTARQLRLAGYRGRLRAHGPLIADQYAMARRAGFDEVEIPDEMAKRQPEDQWLARADWQDHDHQSRLRAAH